MIYGTVLVNKTIMVGMVDSRDDYFVRQIKEKMQAKIVKY